MKAMGLRPEVDCFHWIVLSGTKHNPVLVEWDKVHAPASYAEEPQRLAFFRERLLTLIDQFKPDIVVVKKTETWGGSNTHIASRHARLRVEGVLLEAAQSHNVPSSAMLWSQVKSGMESKHAKEYAERADEVRGINLETRNKNVYEALAAAIAALEGE